MRKRAAMKKKPPERFSLHIRYREEDKDQFKKASELEGFGGNVSMWVLVHMRRIAKETIQREGDQK